MSEFGTSSVGLKAKQTGLLSRLDFGFSPDDTNFSLLSGCTTRTALPTSSNQSVFKMPQRPPWHQQHHLPHQKQQPKLRQQQLLNLTTANMNDSLKSTIFSYLESASTNLSVEQEMFLYIQMNKVIYDFNKEMFTGMNVNRNETTEIVVPRTGEPMGQIPVKPIDFEGLLLDQHSTQLESEIEKSLQNSRIPDNFVRPSSSSSNNATRMQSQRCRQPLSRIPESNIKNPHKFTIPNLQDDYTSFWNKAPGTSAVKQVSGYQQLGKCSAKPSTAVDKRDIFKKGLFTCPDENSSPELKSNLSIMKRSNSLMKKTPQLNSSRLKSVFSERSRLDTTITEQSKKIVNWTLKRKDCTKQVELIGHVLTGTTEPVDLRPSSVGTIVSRKGDAIVKTTTGTYELIGNMAFNRDLPLEVRQQFRTQFPKKWRKVLNKSGMLDSRNVS